RDIVRILRSDWPRVLLVIIATLPLFPLVFLLKPIKDIFEIPQNVGYALLFTGLLLFLGERFAASIQMRNSENNWRSALCIGVFQAIAIIPGVSRSGSTISAARVLGWDRVEAARFSFLMAIPAILGGVCLEVLEIVSGKAVVATSAWQPYAVGFVASFVVGWLALIQLLRLVSKGNLRIFIWYCLALGLGWLAYLHVN
ncbi:MAG: undecaprenyl-diphosphate phosphatase, partial [Chlamydiia bacterium]|nr:undecaprenyl-diphosphate phosphatase [Chlamydiia bacterium]